MNDPYMDENERNCIRFRKGEKKVLHFLKDCHEIVEVLVELNQEDALKRINIWKIKDKDNHFRTYYYFQEFCNLL